MEENKTPFHEEDLRRQRKNEIKMEIHRLGLIPLEKTLSQNNEFVYNYKIILNHLNNLFTEISNDLSQKEEEICERSKKILTESLIFSPIHETSLKPMGKVSLFSKPQSKLIFHGGRWLKFSEALDNYKKFIFKLDCKYSGEVKTKSVKRGES